MLYGADMTHAVDCTGLLSIIRPTIYPRYLIAYSTAVSGTAVVPAQLTVLSTVDLKFKVAATWEENELNVALGLQACGFGKCLTEVPVIRNLRFGPHSRRKRSFGGMDSFCQHLFLKRALYIDIVIVPVSAQRVLIGAASELSSFLLSLKSKQLQIVRK